MAAARSIKSLFDYVSSPRPLNNAPIHVETTHAECHTISPQVTDDFRNRGHAFGSNANIHYAPIYIVRRHCLAEAGATIPRTFILVSHSSAEVCGTVTISVLSARDGETDALNAPKDNRVRQMPVCAMAHPGISC